MSDELPFPSPFDVQASGRKLSDFLTEDVFGKGIMNDEAEALNRVTHDATNSSQPTQQNQGGIFSLMSPLQSLFDQILGKENEVSSTSKEKSILDVAKEFNDNVNHTLKATSDTNTKDMDKFWSILDQCKQQWSTVAKDSKAKDIAPLAFMYYVGFEESRKTPSYKRREHRFYPSLDNVDLLYDLHNGLYLATISYMNKVQDITDSLNDFKGSPWVMLYCEVTSQPRQPAHYICVKKDHETIKGNGFRFPWQEEDALDFLMVVRGTKEISDVLSDALIETTPYDGGLAHGGIYQSGKYLVDKHTPLLQTLLKESKRDKIRLSIIGHSLGAGAGAIAAMEFNKLKHFEAKAIGFGCPPVLSKDVSESTKDFITTIVCDSDVVPRMSGATISNVLMEVLSRPYKEMAMGDVHQILDALDSNSSIKLSKEQHDFILNYVEKGLDDEYEKYKVAYNPLDVVLYPPGKCLHMYRDGVGVSAAYVPCTFFKEIDVTRTMLLDHGTSDGYDNVFHEMMRGYLKQIHFKFPHDIEKITAGMN